MPNFEGGQAGRRAFVLTTTSAVTLATGGATDTNLIKRLYFAEVAGATPTLTIEINDGTTSFDIVKGRLLSANQTYHLDDIALADGDTLKATASASNQIHITMAVVERNQGAVKS